MAFRPRRFDTDGLSVWRAKERTMEDVARCCHRKHYYVAALRVRDLQDEGLELEVTESDQGPGHFIIPQLDYSSRKGDQSLERQRYLALICAMHDPLRE